MKFVVVWWGFLFVHLFSFSSLFHPYPLPLKENKQTKPKQPWILFLSSHLEAVVPHAKRRATFSITEQSHHTIIHITG